MLSSHDVWEEQVDAGVANNLFPGGKGRRRRSHSNATWHLLRRLTSYFYQWHRGTIMCPHAVYDCCQYMFQWVCGNRSAIGVPCFNNFALIIWMARKLKQGSKGSVARMSESDPEAPWTIGPDAEDGAPEGPRTGPPAGPLPPETVDNCRTCQRVAAWQGLSHAFSGAIIQVLNTCYATPFTGSVLTYLPQELLRPYHGLQRLVVSVRPMRSHEEHHPLILEAGLDEAEVEPDDTETATMEVEGPRPPSTPPPAHLLRPEAATTAEAAPTSPGEEALATAVADITSRMEAEGRSRMTATEERLLQEIMDPLEAEEEDEAPGPDSSRTEEAAEGSSTRATPKPRAKGTRKYLCWTGKPVWVISALFWQLLNETPGRLSVYAGDSAFSNARSERTCRPAPAEGILGAHSPASSRCQGLWTATCAVTFGLRAFTGHITMLGRRTAHKKEWCQQTIGWICSIINLIIFMNTTIRYRTPTSLPSTWVGDLQWHKLTIVRFINMIVYPLAGLIMYFRAKQTKQSSASRHIYAQHKTGIHSTTTICSSAGETSKRIQSSSTGPKSGHIHRHTQSAVLLQLVILMLHVLPLRAVNVDVRVGGLAATPPGASSGAKPSGIREASVPKLERADPTRIAKRTYRRAYARAVRHGGSYYQGRWRELSWYQKTTIQPVCAPRTRHVRSAEGHHIRVCTWNAGGLTRPTFQEVETWIRDRGIDVMFIQETKWAEEITITVTYTRPAPRRSTR